MSEDSHPEEEENDQVQVHEEEEEEEEITTAEYLVRKLLARFEKSLLENDCP